MSLPTDILGISGFWFTEFENVHNVHSDTYIKEPKTQSHAYGVTVNGVWIDDGIYWTL
jgi:hypothetical protein